MAAAKEAVVRRMVDALQRADAAAIAELVGDNVVYHFPGRSPLAGTYRGRAEVLGLFGAFGRLLGGPPRLINHDIVASEAHVVELSTHDAVRDGKPFEWRVARIYHIDVDQVTEIWLMIEEVHGFDAWLGAD